MQDLKIDSVIKNNIFYEQCVYAISQWLQSLFDYNMGLAYPEYPIVNLWCFAGTGVLF